MRHNFVIKMRILNRVLLSVKMRNRTINFFTFIILFSFTFEI